MSGSETTAPQAVSDANPVDAGARWAIMGISVWTTTGVGVVSAVPTGLEATAITEFAGPFWSGRALGVQNTTQRLLAGGGTPLFGVLITASAYPPAWALCGLFPLLAAPLVPVDLPPGLRTTKQRAPR